MLMLCRSNAVCQFTFVMIIDVTERSNAMTFCLFIRVDGFQQVTYQVAHGFRAIEIATLVYYCIKLPGELVIKRYSKAFHIKIFYM